MGKSAGLDKLALLQRLPRIEPKQGSEAEMEELRKLSLGAALRLLAQLDHEHEYLLCRSAAQFLLGAVPEPEDVELET